jgi:hypothetical protein
LVPGDIATGPHPAPGELCCADEEENLARVELRESMNDEVAREKKSRDGNRRGRIEREGLGPGARDIRAKRRILFGSLTSRS